MKWLRGTIRPYAWGSRHALAALRGLPTPSALPEAELWFGAHPGAPSRIGRDRLDRLIAAAPAELLGPAVVAEFGPRLPYLLKVLAAEQPLSLQAHPDAARAARQFAAGNPNYVDDQHKPELLVALDDFEVLCGFRSPAATAELLSGVPALFPVVAQLRAGDLRAATATLLAADRALLAEVLATADRLPAAQRDLLTDLAGRNPADPGALVALLLHQLTLAPGEAVYLPAGNPHAYLRGVGVEIMAASDNVLRGGLTTKRVDVPELLAALRFEAVPEPRLRPVPATGGVVTWPTPAREFTLHRAVIGPEPSTMELSGAGPRILLCVAGRLKVDGLSLVPGEAAFASAADPAVTVTGAGTLFQASVPGAGPGAG